MKVVRDYGPLPSLARAIGEPGRLVLRFSEAERRALRRAAALADEARELWRASVDYDPENEAMDTELALIGCHVDEVVDGIDLGEAP